jgi:uncharacterized protein (TIGR02444 family)
MSNSATSSPQGSPFWRFSLGLYRRPGVGDACIALQDSCSVDVNLLLFLLWLAASGRRLGIAEVKDLEAKASGWRETVVVPLRSLRRSLKGRALLVEPGAAEAFRSRIKAVELEAERLQQEALYELASSSPLGAPYASVADAARENVAAYADALGQTFPSAPVEALLDAFLAFATTG